MNLRGTAISALLASSLWIAALPAEPALADTREDVMSTAQRCAAIADDRAWLDCFYGSAEPMRARLGLQAPHAAPQQPVPGATAPAQSSTRSFLGRLATGVLGDEKPIVANMRMKAYSIDPKTERFTATLVDGEVWEELNHDGMRASWTLPAAQYVVNIYPGTFGSFNLQIEGDSQIYKARRLK